jgi:hypothetical protein
MNTERQWLIYSSFALSFVLFFFFCTAPAVGYRLNWPDAIGLLQITLPVFVGYLAAASVWAFSTSPPADPPDFKIDPVRKALLRGPIVLVALMLTVVLVVFGYSQRDGASIGSGMSVGQLTTFITTALGILTVTTGVGLVALFPRKDEDDKKKKPADSGSPA